MIMGPHPVRSAPPSQGLRRPLSLSLSLSFSLSLPACSHYQPPQLEHQHSVVRQHEVHTAIPIASQAGAGAKVTFISPT